MKIRYFIILTGRFTSKVIRRNFKWFKGYHSGRSTNTKRYHIRCFAKTHIYHIGCYTNVKSDHRNFHKRHPATCRCRHKGEAQV